MSQSSGLTLRRSVEILLKAGRAEFVTFNGFKDLKEHFALCFGNWKKQRHPLVRLHSECLTGDLFGSHRCDCGGQLQEALKLFSQNGGILIYLRQEGRGIGLYNKIDAYALQLEGADTFEANRMLGFDDDPRGYAAAAKMLCCLGKTNIRLLTNNPRKIEDLEAGGIEIKEARPTGVFIEPDNRAYLEAKVIKARHSLALGVS